MTSCNYAQSKTLKAKTAASRAVMAIVQSGIIKVKHIKTDDQITYQANSNTQTIEL